MLKGLGPQMDIFLMTTYKIKSVLSVYAQMILKIEKNKCDISACFFEITYLLEDCSESQTDVGKPERAS
jgi:hypothetical protein